MFEAPRVAVVLFPGSNRERDAVRAFKTVGGVDASIVRYDERTLPVKTGVVVIPGGFSYGDYLRCGAIAARSPIMNAVRAHANNGGKVVGICNGFQILCEAGLLPGILMRNRNRRFVCRMQHLSVDNANSSFLRSYRSGEIIKVAIAHGEGNYVCSPDILKQLEGQGRVAFRYCDAEGRVGGEANPNGSVNDVAGIYSENFNVLGLMPHPENLIDSLVGGTDGRPMFAALLA